MKVTHYSNNIGFTFDVELTEAQRDALALRGIKALAGGVMPTVAKAYLGVAKLPVGFKGESIPCDDKARAEFVKALEGLTLGDDVLSVTSVSTFPYLNTADKARATAKLGQWESADVLESHLETKCGYTGATHGEDGEFHPEALVAVHALIEKALAALNV